MNPGYTLDPNEAIIRRINRHWIALLPVYLSAVAILVVMIGLTYIGSRYSDQVGRYLPSGLLVLLLIILVALAFLIVLAGQWIFAQNYLLLTSHHIIRVQQLGLFNRSVSQLSLSRVQDVSSSRPGFLATVLNFGNVTIETAGEEENFVFTMVANPSQLADDCLVAHDKFAGTMDGATKPDM